MAFSEILQKNSLMSRSLRSVWHPCTQMQHHETIPLIPVAHGKGAWLYDTNGKRYLDAISSWWVNIFGHANPRIGDAVKDQIDKIEHAMLAGFTHEPVVKLSERLSALTKGKLGHCFYASDGASATEIALKMSFHSHRNTGQPKKQKFICLQGSYHGETIGALSVTDVPIFREAYGSLLNQVYTAPTPDARKAKNGETSKDVAKSALDDLEKYLKNEAENVSAVIVEPLVQCANGMTMYDPFYLKGLRELCNRYEIHMIADEIAVGCGRTGTFFAHEQAEIVPDFLCLSKGISGGYLPLSIVMTRENIYQSFYSEDLTRGFLHSHSYTGNPLACRAALAVLDIFEHDDIINKNIILSEKISSAFAPIKQDERVNNFRQHGMILAFDVKINSQEKQTQFPRNFFACAQKHELLLRPIGNTVYVMPPYILSDEEIEFLADGTYAVLKEVMQK